MTEQTAVADAVFMRRALELAELGRGRTSPNPVVGAVLVLEGEIVGSGHHERFGGAHAEVNALREAGGRANGATLFVTLEPCCVAGKTPPCTDAIIAAGISRVVVPTLDPNPDVCGRGLEILREAGIEVELGLMRKQAEDLNRAYIKHRRTGMPSVTLKLALSLDGRAAPPAGGPRWTSSEESRALVHALRAESDCVLVGVGTVLEDDPLLTDRRDASPARQPARLVLDSHLRTPFDSALVGSAHEVTTVVACAKGADPTRRAALEDAGVTVWPVEGGERGLDLRDVLARAARHGFLSILAEGGPEVATGLLTAGLVDRVKFFVAPRLHGAGGPRALGELGEDWWGGGARFENTSWTVVGGDCLFEADVVPAEDE